MKIIFSYSKELWKSQFWLTPAIIILALIALQVGLEAIDLEVEETYFLSLLFEHSSAEGAREVLSTIAGSLITVVGVLFSITVLVVQQLGSQYTPRTIQSFTKSVPSQVVLGAYIGTFCYCLLLLRKVHGENGGEEATIPEVAISVGILLAIVCLALLVYYIHHLTQSFKSTTVIANAAQETIASIKRFYEDSYNAGKENKDSHQRQRLPYHVMIPAGKSGYLAMFRWRKLGRVLQDDGPWLITLLVTPGDYIHEGQPLLELSCRKVLDDKTGKKICALFSIARERTYAQDPRFGARQIVDVALRALSPSLNDPTTAIEALDRLGDIVKALTFTRMETLPIHFKGGGVLQLRQPEYKEFLGLCFNQILMMAQTNLNPTLLKRILEILRMCQQECPEPSKLHALCALEREVADAISSTENLGPFREEIQELLRR